MYNYYLMALFERIRCNVCANSFNDIVVRYDDDVVKRGLFRYRYVRYV